MTLRKISVLALAFMFVMIFAGNSFAVLGEGYFGTDNPTPNGIIIDPPFYDSPYSVNQAIPAPTPTPRPIPTPTPEPIPQPKPRPDSSWEKYSTNSEKVIPSYGLDTSTTVNLLDLHYSAARGNGKRERYDRYVMIFSDFPKDYLAAYEAARNAYEMTEYDMAMHWVNKALEILPQYVPARQFKRTVEGALKRR